MKPKFPKTTNAAVILAAAMLLTLVGCGQRNAGEPPDDEAMKRLVWENKYSKVKKTPEEAAKRYFLPKDYFDPDEKDEETGKGTGVTDYLKGMDRIVVSPTWKPQDGPALDPPAFQLLGPEKPLPEFRVETDPLWTNNEILGRNTWMLWCGGNEGFWDWLATDSLGFIDLLKLVDSRKRVTRFDQAGLINEPGMMQNGGVDQFGLWIDLPADSGTRKWRNDYLSKTFESIKNRNHKSQRGLDRYGESTSAADSYSTSDESYGKESGTKYGDEYEDDYNSEYPPPDIYGVSSGIVGLRLFPNPNFDEAARNEWDADRYYNDAEYFNSPDLVRPYRVGVACAFCHASFHPLNPPRDVNSPSWENISGNIGAQYLRVRVAFANLLEPDNFVYHLLDSQPPGTIDTSLIASDNINNTNAMNSVFNLPQRALLSLRNPKENITASSASQPTVWRLTPDDAPPESYVKLFQSQDLLDEALGSNSHPPRRVPRILLDGSDSIGAWGALARVYLNIGTYYEQWNRLHRPVVGFEPQNPFAIVDCERHSLYWHATQDRVAALRDYFLKATPPMPLLATEGASERIDPIDEAKLRQQAQDEKQDFSELLARGTSRHVDVKQLPRGRTVFAHNCIVCHSSIQPESSAVTFFREQQQRDEYNARFADLIAAREEYRANDAALGEFWEHDPARWLGDEKYVEWAEDAVNNYPEFWQLNYLSTDYRVPITLVRTNSARAMATNALDKNMWDDFASESYQHLPSVGAIEYFNPYKGPDGGMEVFSPRHKVRNDAQSGGGGPGFYRVPTLVSIWTTAPLLHNNSLGKFTNDPSIDGRLEAFDDGIRKLLWPELRLESSSYNGATAERLKRDHGLIWRTSEETHLTISGRRVPALLGSEVAAVMRFSERYPWLRKVRPLWLPSSILLLTSFLLLVLSSPKHWRVVGVLFLLASLILFLLGFYGRAAWLAWIYPLWLPAAILLVAGLLFLAIDCKQTLRYLAYFALVVGVIGFVLYFLNDKWPWLAGLNKSGPLATFSLLAASIGVLLLVLLRFTKSWRYGIGWICVIFAGIGVLMYIFEANVGGYRMAGDLGAIWIYSPLLVAAAIVLFTPDERQFTRYLGYASLVLSLGVGLIFYFSAGKLGDLRIGPIPKGTPVNLLANLNPNADPKDLKQAVKITVGALSEIKSKHLNDEQTQKLLRERVAPALMKVNKCPDFVMDHGHYYAWFDDMTDDDKNALIELLKTF